MMVIKQLREKHTQKNNDWIKKYFGSKTLCKSSVQFCQRDTNTLNKLFLTILHFCKYLKYSPKVIVRGKYFQFILNKSFNGS